MRNHDQKIKDMSRSVLPSTGRKSARDNRRIIHKQQRARELAAVTAYRRDTGPDIVTPDVGGTYGPDITQMVWGRRAQDKVGPLIRWAEARIAADPVLRSAPRAEQVAYFARLMPDTTIGRHAVQHIEQALQWRERRARYNASRPSAPGPHAAEMERQLRRILETGLHATLNAALRQLAGTQEIRPRATPMPRRLCQEVTTSRHSPRRWPAGRWPVTWSPPSPRPGCPPKTPATRRLSEGCSRQARATGTEPDEHASTAITARSRDLPAPEPADMRALL